jgi:hypothetical protein
MCARISCGVNRKIAKKGAVSADGTSRVTNAFGRCVHNSDYYFRASRGSSERPVTR